MIGKTNVKTEIHSSPTIVNGRFVNNNSSAIGAQTYNLFTAPAYKYTLKLAFYADTLGSNTAYLQANGVNIVQLHSAWNNRQGSVTVQSSSIPAGATVRVYIDGLKANASAAYAGALYQVN